ncbi:unnamed protein product [Schistosoma mattheei]|uniref:Uncharacterized protein n=1 Tax=Schistosoma mattheei TaxID=31246 RepID=A0A183NJB3_9TREM|nr:unnamed protein product [Schistosoma mattheei]
MNMCNLYMTKIIIKQISQFGSHSNKDMFLENFLVHYQMDDVV